MHPYRMCHEGKPKQYASRGFNGGGFLKPIIKITNTCWIYTLHKCTYCGACIYSANMISTGPCADWWWWMHNKTHSHCLEALTNDSFCSFAYVRSRAFYQFVFVPLTTSSVYSNYQLNSLEDRAIHMDTPQTMTPLHINTPPRLWPCYT